MPNKDLQQSRGEQSVHCGVCLEELFVYQQHTVSRHASRGDCVLPPARLCHCLQRLFLGASLMGCSLPDLREGFSFLSAVWRPCPALLNGWSICRGQGVSPSLNAVGLRGSASGKVCLRPWESTNQSSICGIRTRAHISRSICSTSPPSLLVTVTTWFALILLSE